MKHYGERICQLEAKVGSLRKSLNRLNSACTKILAQYTNQKAFQNNYVKRVIKKHKEQKQWLYRNFTGVKFAFKALSEMKQMRNLFKVLRGTKIKRINKTGRYLVFLTRNEAANFKSFLNRDNRKRSSLKIRPGKYVPYLTRREYGKFKWLLRRKRGIN